MPEFAVFIPVYNSEDTLPMCLDSLIAQDCQDWIAFAVDDKSSDSSLPIVQTYQMDDPRIISLQNSVNKGCGGSRNTGMTIAHTIGSFKYYAFLDSDDLWDKDHLTNLQQEFQRTQADVVYSDPRFVHWPSFEPYPELRPSHTPEIFDFKLLFELGNYIIVSSSAVRSSVIDRIGYFDSNLRALEDYDMWIRCGMNGLSFSHIPKEDLTYTRSETSLSDRIPVEMEKLKRKYGYA